jgi:tRNA(Phe) wybutosine-synthesizing methylase Tyw3
MREQVIQTIDTVKRLLEIHITQVENLEQRLARLEEALTPKEENNG